MTKSSVEQGVFRRGSTTYYWSTRFFPRNVRDDVLKLYSFVRVADDYVDANPQQKARFRELRRSWTAAMHDPHFDTTPTAREPIPERVIKNMVHVSRTYAFDNAWVEAFLDTMQADLAHEPFRTLADMLSYTYGSAEVIGLMMAKILGLSPDAYEPAMLQGRAMQLINFIRDISEDAARGRCYFPREELDRFGLPDLQQGTAQARPSAFEQFMRFQLDRYRKWQAAARPGFVYLPRRTRIAVATAADMYHWTSQVIAAEPHIVYRRRVKPNKYQVMRTGLMHLIA